MSEAAEEAGFDGISLMDHLIQIPQVGREWEDFPEAYSSLAFLAGRTSNLTLGCPGHQRRSSQSGPARQDAGDDRCPFGRSGLLRTGGGLVRGRASRLRL